MGVPMKNFENETKFIRKSYSSIVLDPTLNEIQGKSQKPAQKFVTDDACTTDIQK